MECKCGNPNCKNEMQFDSLGMTILVTKEIELSGVKTSEPILFYVTPESAQELINHMREYIPPVEPTESKSDGVWSDGTTNDHDSDAIFYHTCPSCNQDELDYGYKFCPNCGVQIKWKFGHLANQS